MSMTNGVAHGVEIYSKKLSELIVEQPPYIYIHLYLKKVKLLSFYRLFWNFFIMPFKVGNNLIYSFSSHGSPFLSNQIITIHDLICLEFPKQHRFQYYYFKYLIPSIIKSSKKIVAISEFTKNEILKYYKLPEDKIEVIYNGVNRLSYFEEEKTDAEFDEIVQGSPFFLTVGASYPHKNIENLLLSIHKLESNNYKYIIVSKKNDYGISLRNLAESKGLKNVVFLDYVSDNLLARLYRDTICNIYISMYEGFGFPPLEAASLGTISLVSDIPVMREVLGDHAFFVDSQSHAAIAEKLNLIIQQYESKNLIKKDYKALLEKYSWERSAKKIIELISKND